MPYNDRRPQCGIESSPPPFEIHGTAVSCVIRATGEEDVEFASDKSV